MNGIQLCGSVCDSDSIKSILQRMQNIIMRRIANVIYITNSEIHKHLETNTVKEAIKSASWDTVIAS